MEPPARKLKRLLDRVKRSPHNTRFVDLCKLIEAAGIPFKRQTASHVMYEDEGSGIFLNVQRTDSGKAKAYQVREVVTVIEDKVLHKGDGSAKKQDT